MARFLTLALLALLAVAEVAAVVLLVDAVGEFSAVLVLMLDVLVGLSIVRWGARSQPPGRGWRMAGGAVIAIPGLVLNVVGVLLLVPAVQSWVSGHVLRSTSAALRRRGVSVVTVTDPSGSPRTTVVPGVVIPGEVVDPPESTADESDSGQPGPADRPSGPGFVRGEILSSDD